PAGTSPDRVGTVKPAANGVAGLISWAPLNVMACPPKVPLAVAETLLMVTKAGTPSMPGKSPISTLIRVPSFEATASAVKGRVQSAYVHWISTGPLGSVGSTGSVGSVGS